jgi:hydroxylamine reductase (hybrid-cluster protein)
MFRDRCEETARGCACTASGVCGKNPETAGLRDVLIWVCRGLAYRNLAAGGQENPDVGLFIAGALFGALTNVDFDPGRIRDLTREAIALRDLLPPAGTDDPEASTRVPANDDAIEAKADEIAVEAALDDVHSLRTLLLAGLRGLAANYCHAASLGYTDETVTEFLQRALASGLRELTADERVGLAKECGTVGGTTVSDRPGILTAGHELADLKQLLELTTGCAHQAVDAIAGSVVEAIRNEAIRRFVVMAGCDGRQPEREYYTEFALALPQDTVILTAGCAKYRYNALDLGTAGGIPRVSDVGQCNDSYSLVAIAQQLAGAFGVGINDLAISYTIAWYEQKAMLVLLAPLSVEVRDITLGPRLPGLPSPGVLDVLVREFGLKKIATVGKDLARMVPAAAGG